MDLPGQQRYHIALNAVRPGAVMAIRRPSDPNTLIDGLSQLSGMGLNLVWPITALTEVERLLGGGGGV